MRRYRAWHVLFLERKHVPFWLDTDSNTEPTHFVRFNRNTVCYVLHNNALPSVSSRRRNMTSIGGLEHLPRFTGFTGALENFQSRTDWLIELYCYASFTFPLFWSTSKQNHVLFQFQKPWETPPLPYFYLPIRDQYVFLIWQKLCRNSQTESSSGSRSFYSHLYRCFWIL